MWVVNIKWDTEGLKIYGLPKDVFVHGIEEDDVADWLSDNYGWCVESFEVI